MKPTSAIIAVTLNCNARCKMCDIWKQCSTDEMRPVEYLKLPASLREINVTGGEPFLRCDLLAIIAAMRQACPWARLVISSNGFLPEKIRRLGPQLARLGSVVAVRVSVDGIGETHNRIRGIPDGFRRALQSLRILKEAGVKDLGIGMTILEENVAEVIAVYRLAEEMNIEFSLTVASDSPIYFGMGKSGLQPEGKEELVKQLQTLVATEYCHRHPKRWFRAWFERELLAYILYGQRALPCDAGEDFFYLDPHGGVYCCHMQPHRLGSLRRMDWQELWQTPEAQTARQKVPGCESCWMVCTARTQIRKNLLKICPQIASDKLKAHIGRQMNQAERHFARVLP